MRTIYCDEAGFTGNNLLSPDQPTFVYATICIDDNSARDITQKAIRTYSLQMKELKGKKLTKTQNGKNAAMDIIKLNINKALLLISDKIFLCVVSFMSICLTP